MAGVECYSNGNAAITDNFQVILIDRPDLGTSANGDNFQIEFNYNSLLWDAGQYTGGDVNCTHASNANSAAAGYSDGSRIAGHFYQLPGSQVSSGTLDSNVSTGLIHNELNSDTATSVPPSGSPVLGRYIFNVNNGQPISPTTLVTSLSGGGDTGTSITVDPNTAVVELRDAPGSEHCDRRWDRHVRRLHQQHLHERGRLRGDGHRHQWGHSRFQSDCTGWSGHVLLERRVFR